jgi:multidrug resistance efflux pump
MRGECVDANLTEPVCFLQERAIAEADTAKLNATVESLTAQLHQGKSDRSEPEDNAVRVIDMGANAAKFEVAEKAATAAAERRASRAQAEVKDLQAEVQKLEGKLRAAESPKSANTNLSTPSVASKSAFQSLIVKAIAGVLLSILFLALYRQSTT